MTPERRAELRRIARAYAFDSAFGGTPMLNALTLAWTFGETRAECRAVVRMFLHAYPMFARRSARALVRLTLRKVQEQQ